METTFDAVAAVWVFRVSQNDRVDDVVTSNLGCQECPPSRKVDVGEFDEAVACDRLQPFVFHDSALGSGQCLRPPGLETARRVVAVLPALNMGMQRVDVGAEFHAMCFVFVEIEGVTLNLRVFTLEGLRLSRQSLVLGCESAHVYLTTIVVERLNPSRERCTVVRTPDSSNVAYSLLSANHSDINPQRDAQIPGRQPQ